MEKSSPQHIAIIMDGNGRWAKQHGLPRIQGHKAGAESVREAIDACKGMGVKYLTLYAFSSENWQRPEAEVKALMLLLEHYLKGKIADLNRQGVRLRAIGQLDRLPPSTRAMLERAMHETAQNQELTLILALSYGSREEITRAVRRIAHEVASGQRRAEEIDEATITAHLDTAGVPDPDLLVRTSGEMRLSNFLLWQISYAELVVVDKFWPDFRQGDLFDAVAQFRKRHRRFGKI